MLNAEGILPCCMPQALRSLSLSAPFCVLRRIVPGLGSFTGLKQLHLGAQCLDGGADDPWDTSARLLPQLLRHLPPQLERLSAADFYEVQLENLGDGAAGAANAGTAAQLLPGIAQLRVYNADAVRFNLPLPRLESLSVEVCRSASFAGRALHLPQLTRLDIEAVVGEPLRCAALPALAQLSIDSPLAASDSFTALRSLTRLKLTCDDDFAEHTALLSGVSASLRSLSVDAMPAGSAHVQRQAAQTVSAVPLPHLTFLVSGQPCFTTALLPCSLASTLWVAAGADAASCCLAFVRAFNVRLCCHRAQLYMCAETAADVMHVCTFSDSGPLPGSHDLQEFSGTACLAHLVCWPRLEELFLSGVSPTDIKKQHVTLLAAAPSLRRLALRFSDLLARPDGRMCAHVPRVETKERRRMQVCRGWRHACQRRRCCCHHCCRRCCCRRRCGCSWCGGSASAACS